MSGPRNPRPDAFDMDRLAQITAEAAPPLTADTIDRLRLVLAAPSKTAEPAPINGRSRRSDQQRHAA